MVLKFAGSPAPPATPPPYRAAPEPEPLPAEEVAPDEDEPPPVEEAPPAPIPPEWNPIDTAPHDGRLICVTDNPIARPDGQCCVWRQRRVNMNVTGGGRRWVSTAGWCSPRTRAEVPFKPLLWTTVREGMRW